MHTGRGHGEALSIRQMVAAAVERFASDPGRVFIAGLSAGGAMTAALLAAYPDVFAAGAVVAGLPVGAAGSTSEALRRMAEAGPARSPADWAEQVRRAAPIGYPGPWPRLSIWHGEADGVVDPANSRLLAGAMVRLAWPRSRGAGHRWSFSACGAIGGMSPVGRSWSCGACPDWRMSGRRGPRAALSTSGTSPRINRAATQCAQDDADSRRVSAMSNEVGMKDVIVADNDYIVRGILRSILEREGFTVLQAVDGLEAIDYAMRVRARLVILDYKMPRLDGFGACAQIRHLPGYADTPIAVLTAFDNEDTRAAAERAGVTTCLAKPFKPVDLLRTIAALLGSSGSRRRCGTQSRSCVVWNRLREPPPLFGEPAELSEGRRVLNICRR